MDTTLAALIFGLAALVVVAVLLWRSQNRGGQSEATVSFGELFTTTVKLGSADTASAENAVAHAAKQRGETPETAAASIARTATRLARVLWVDDLPDNNLYETVALEKLGRFVTKATSTEAGLTYLEELDFALVITDLGRRHDRHAGEEFIRLVRASGRTEPIVVYTVGAADKRAALVAAGADAVVDRPSDLVREVEARIDAADRAGSPGRPNLGPPHVG
jgi:CheY-like chemotaxis protein